MSGVRQRKLRERLFKRFGKCFHCDRELVLYSDDLNQDNLAALENKYSFWDRMRHTEIHELRWRIVCLKCLRKNHKKSQSKVPTIILHELAHKPKT